MTLFFNNYISINQFLIYTLKSIVNIIPNIIGLGSNIYGNIACSLLIISITFINYLKSKKDASFLYSLILIFFYYSYCFSIQLINKLFVNSFFYSITIYCLPLIPFIICNIIYFLKNSLKTDLSQTIKYLLIVIIISINLFLGYSYRAESFDVINYSNILKKVDHPSYLVPSFINKVMYLRLLNNFDHDYHNQIGLFKIDDFKTIKSPYYSFFVVEYKELGNPFYDYTNYENMLIKYLKQNKLQYLIKNYKTFKEYRITL